METKAVKKCWKKSGKTPVSVYYVHSSAAIMRDKQTNKPTNKYTDKIRVL